MIGGQSRRSMLGCGLAAAALAAGRVDAADNDTVRGALDAALAEADPGRALALLSGFAEGGLSASDRLDLVTARAGLRVDVLLANVGKTGRYPLLLRRSFASHVDPGGAEKRLRSGLAYYLKRATALFDRLGVDGATPGARYGQLWQRPPWLYADNDSGRDLAISDMNAVLTRYRSAAMNVLGPVPPWCLNVSARRISAADEAAGKGGYRELPTPGRPGAYYVDLKAIRRRPSWTLPSVVAHELLPGHMAQMPMEAVAAPHRLRQRYTAGYGEGWAAYAETLVATLGLFDDPMAELGHIHWMLFRLSRGLVDIGVHIHGWTKDQALEHLREWQGEPAYFAPFESDVDRIVREPATRAAEALYWLAIADGAHGMRGQRLMRYHYALLIDGPMRGEEIDRLGRR